MEEFTMIKDGDTLIVILCIFLTILHIVLIMNGVKDTNRDFDIMDGIDEKTLNNMKNDTDINFDIDKKIIIKDRENIDIHNISNPNLKLSDLIQDINDMINLVVITELYSIEIQGTLRITKDRDLKLIAKTLTDKTVNSISDNFRSKIYLFINENLFIEIVYSNVMRQLLNIASNNMS